MTVMGTEMAVIPRDQVRSVRRHPGQSRRAIMVDRYGVTAEAMAPAIRVTATLTNRPANTSAETLPGGSMAAMTWSTSKPPEATTELNSTGTYWRATSREAWLLP